MNRNTRAVLAIELAMKSGFTLLRSGILIGKSGRPSRSKPSRAGYLWFSVKDGTGKMYKGQVHQFQAYLKFGDSLFDETKYKVFIRHLNGVSTDNSWDNIAIGSNSDNMMDREASDRMRCSLLAAKAKRVLTEDSVREIRNAKSSGSSLGELSIRYGLSKGHLSDIINRKLYRDVLP